MVPTGITASVPAKPAGVSPVCHTPTTPTYPPRSTTLAAHQHAPPRPLGSHRHLTMESEESPTDPRRDNWERGAAESAATREGTTSTTLSGHRPDTARREHQAHGLAEPLWARKAPAFALLPARRRRRCPTSENAPIPAPRSSNGPPLLPSFSLKYPAIKQNRPLRLLIKTGRFGLSPGNVINAIEQRFGGK